MSKALGYFLVCAIVTGQGSIAYGAGNANSGKAKSAACGGCHGNNGNSVAPTFPRLAGQHGKYVARQLSDFKSLKRNDPTMQAMASGLSEQNIENLSAFYASQKPDYSKSDPAQSGDDKEIPDDKELIARGKTLFLAGNEATAVPACSGCHGPGADGNGLAGFPKLKGQFLPYLVKSLNDFKDGVRSNDEGATMRTIAGKMSKAEINAVSAYLSDLR
ncbi:MAG: c-type cytochrome [Methylococcales bacterium]